MIIVFKFVVYLVRKKNKHKVSGFSLKPLLIIQIGKFMFQLSFSLIGQLPLVNTHSQFSEKNLNHKRLTEQLLECQAAIRKLEHKLHKKTAKNCETHQRSYTKSSVFIYF